MTSAPADTPGCPAQPPEPAYADELLSIRIDGNGVVRVAWTTGTTITGPIARQSVDIVLGLTDDEGALLLVDLSGVAALTREARQVYASPMPLRALALVGQSPVHRVMATFAVGVRPMPVPTRFFATAREAELWLLTHIA